MFRHLTIQFFTFEIAERSTQLLILVYIPMRAAFNRIEYTSKTNIFYDSRFEVLMVMTVFFNVMPCSLAEMSTHPRRVIFRDKKHVQF
jgi:hypothetical protein